MILYWISRWTNLFNKPIITGFKTLHSKNYANDLPCVVFCCGLTHWGRVTHICVSKLTIIGSDNGLSPGRRQAIIWTNAGILLIGPLGTNFSEISSEINIFSFKKMHFKTSSAKLRPFCLGLNGLISISITHNPQIYFTGTKTIIQLPQYQWI